MKPTTTQTANSAMMVENFENQVKLFLVDCQKTVAWKDGLILDDDEVVVGEIKMTWQRAKQYGADFCQHLVVASTYYSSASRNGLEPSIILKARAELNEAIIQLYNWQRDIRPARLTGTEKTHPMAGFISDHDLLHREVKNYKSLQQRLSDLFSSEDRATIADNHTWDQMIVSNQIFCIEIFRENSLFHRMIDMNLEAVTQAISALTAFEIVVRKRLEKPMVINNADKSSMLENFDEHIKIFVSDYRKTVELRNATFCNEDIPMMGDMTTTWGAIKLHGEELSRKLIVGVDAYRSAVESSGLSPAILATRVELNRSITQLHHWHRDIEELGLFQAEKDHRRRCENIEKHASAIAHNDFLNNIIYDYYLVENRLSRDFDGKELEIISANYKWGQLVVGNSMFCQEMLDESSAYRVIIEMNVQSVRQATAALKAFELGLIKMRSDKKPRRPWSPAVFEKFAKGCILEVARIALEYSDASLDEKVEELVTKYNELISAVDKEVPPTAIFRPAFPPVNSVQWQTVKSEALRLCRQTRELQQTIRKTLRAKDGNGQIRWTEDDRAVLRELAKIHKELPSITSILAGDFEAFKKRAATISVAQLAVDIKAEMQSLFGKHCKLIDEIDKEVKAGAVFYDRQHDHEWCSVKAAELKFIDEFVFTSPEDLKRISAATTTLQDGFEAFKTRRDDRVKTRRDDRVKTYKEKVAAYDALEKRITDKYPHVGHWGVTMNHRNWDEEKSSSKADHDRSLKVLSNGFFNSVGYNRCLSDVDRQMEVMVGFEKRLEGSKRQMTTKNSENEKKFKAELKRCHRVIATIDKELDTSAWFFDRSHGSWESIRATTIRHLSDLDSNSCSDFDKVWAITGSLEMGFEDFKKTLDSRLKEYQEALDQFMIVENRIDVEYSEAEKDNFGASVKVTWREFRAGNRGEEKRVLDGIQKGAYINMVYEEHRDRVTLRQRKLESFEKESIAQRAKQRTTNEKKELSAVEKARADLLVHIEEQRALIKQIDAAVWPGEIFDAKHQTNWKFSKSIATGYCDQLSSDAKYINETTVVVQGLTPLEFLERKITSILLSRAVLDKQFTAYKKAHPVVETPGQTVVETVNSDELPNIYAECVCLRVMIDDVWRLTIKVDDSQSEMYVVTFIGVNERLRIVQKGKSAKFIQEAILTLINAAGAKRLKLLVMARLKLGMDPHEFDRYEIESKDVLALKDYVHQLEACLVQMK